MEKMLKNMPEKTLAALLAMLAMLAMLAKCEGGSTTAQALFNAPFPRDQAAVFVFR